MTPKIHYVPNTYQFVGKDFHTCSQDEFVSRLQKKQPTYEVITNDSKVKYYFDFDYYISSSEFDLEVANAVNTILKKRITDSLNAATGCIPKIHILQSHSQNIGDGRGKYSLRYYISNMIGLKQNVKDFAIDLNKYFDKKEPELWDYIEKPETNVFDISIYDSNKKMRCYETNKPNEIRPLVLQEGTIEGTVITGCFDTDATEFNYVSTDATKKDKSSKPDKVVSSVKNFDKISELGEIISIKYIGVAGCYHDWCKIIWSLRSESDEYKEIARDISKRGGNLYDEDVFEKTWDAFTQKGMTINTFYYYCKSSNDNQFKQICAKYSDNKTTDDTSYYTTIENIKDLYQCSILIASKLKDTVILCNEQWFVLQSTNLWNKVKDPTFQITTQIRKYIDYNNARLSNDLTKCDDDEQHKLILKQIKLWIECYTLINGSGYMTPLMKNLRPQLTDNEFETKLDVLKYQVAYKNGILDLKSLYFREGIFGSDYITKTIPYNYEASTEADRAIVLKELLKICNMKQEHLDYYLSYLGYAMTGDSQRLQQFWYMLGQTASNGKSVIFEALMEIIPNYIVKIENTAFEMGNNAIHKEVATWRGARIGWVNELTKKKQDAELFKQIADGTTIKYKVMYGNSANMNINFKMCVVSQHTISINADKGVGRRLKVLKMNSSFMDEYTEDDYVKCRFKKDTNFGVLLQTQYKFALMDIIYSYSKRFYENDFKMCDYPDEWKQETEESIATNNEFNDFFYAHFEIDPDAILSKRVVDEIISQYKGSIRLKDELLRMGIHFTYDCKKKAPKERGQGTWTGFKVIEKIDLDE
jgi:hypothetical protein